MGSKSAFFGDHPSIIYLTNNVCPASRFNSDVAGELWRGLQDESRAQDIDVLAVVSTVMDMGDISVSHDLVDGFSADGFIIWRSDRHNKDYFQRFANHPVVCLTTPHEPYPVVSIPSRPGILDIVHHLVDTHGFSRIAFLGGPEQHPAAQERYAAYQDALHEQGLVLNPRLVVLDGSWEFSWGMDCVRILLDERGLVPGRDIEAIICSADQVSMGVISELAKRQISVPGQIAVTGYNNAPIASSLSLTTVNPPFQRQARQAHAMLMQAMGLTEQPAEEDALQPVLQVGQSCGCGEQHYLHLNPAELSDLPAMLAGHLHHWLPLHTARAEASRILAAFSQVIAGIENMAHVIDCLIPHLQAGRFVTREQAFWQIFFACYRVQMQPAKVHAETVLNQIHKKIDAHLRHACWFMTARENQIIDLIPRLANRLSLAGSMAELLALVRRDLSQLVIHSCWLVSYDTPVRGPYAPMRGRLVLAMEQDNIYPLPENGLSFELPKLVPEGYRKGFSPGAFTLFPLRFGLYEYGYVIFNSSDNFPFYQGFTKTIAAGMHNLASTLSTSSESIMANYSEKWFGTADSVLLRQKLGSKTL